MKITLLLTFIIISTVSISQIPDYFGNTPSWSAGESDSGNPLSGGSETPSTTKEIYYLDGIQTFGEFNYYKLNKKSQTTFDFTMGVPEPLTTSFVMYVRQEERAIYFYHQESGQDSLYINYNLEVGDHFTGYFGAINPYDTITAIDSVLVGESYRLKLYNLEPTSDNPFLIEGIGSSANGTTEDGLHFSIPEFGMEGIGFNTYMRCYSDNNTTLWTCNDSFTDCYLTLDTPDRLSKSIQIYPNPVNNFLQINGELDILSLKILSLDGKHVKTIRNNKNIDLSNLNSGNYILEIETTNKEITRKKIIKN